MHEKLSYLSLILLSRPNHSYHCCPSMCRSINISVFRIWSCLLELMFAAPIMIFLSQSLPFCLIKHKRQGTLYYVRFQWPHKSIIYYMQLMESSSLNENDQEKLKQHKRKTGSSIDDHRHNVMLGFNGSISPLDIISNSWQPLV